MPGKGGARVTPPDGAFRLPVVAPSNEHDAEPSEFPEHEQALHNAALGYWELGSGLGGPDYEFAIVLEALSLMARRGPSDPHLKQLAKAAEAYFRAFPDLHPYAPNRAAGATQILKHLEQLADQRKHDGLPLEWMAIHLIDDVPQLRAGRLPTIRAYYEATSQAEKEHLMGELKEKLIAELARLEPYRDQDVTEWAEKATRAVLRVFGDPDPDNALKHLLKK